MRTKTHRVVVFTLLLIAGIHADTSNQRARKVLVKRTPVAKSAPETLLDGAAPAPFSLDEHAGADAVRESRSAANARWARLVSDYVSGRSDRSNQLPSWTKDVVMVDLPLGSARDDLPSSVPVLVLPVPIPSGECSANQGQERFEFGRRQPQRPRPVEYEEPAPPAPPAPQRRPEYRPAPSGPPRSPFEYEPSAPSGPPRSPVEFRPAAKAGPPRSPFELDPPAPAPRRPPSTNISPPRKKIEILGVAPPPPLPPRAPVNPEELIAMFRAQKPTAPELPPVLIRDRRYDVQSESTPVERTVYVDVPAKAPANGYLPVAPPAPARGRGTPPPPRFDRPLMIRGEITVYRADYTEPYTAMWDPSGATRLEMHGGTTTSYRMVDSSRRVTRAAVNLDRSAGSNVMRCFVMRQSSLTPSDSIPPVLPDTKEFKFDGYTEFGNVRAEKWKQTVSGRAGEMGGAQGEALAYRHEMLLMRDPNNSAMPLQYSVAVDSSVLGPDCDGYVHRYHEVREQKHDPSIFQINLDQTCDAVEETQEVSQVEPLREFVMMARDTRYDDAFKEFARSNGIKYANPAEEAVRKNLFTQTSRFVSSGNRIGATFSMAINFLADRLAVEIEQMLGVAFDQEHFPAENFPHDRSKLRVLADKLPEEFDWRERGGVTHVRNQGSMCASCWAFSVVGAVEGALFRLTGRLIPLSEQTLVDCAHPYGGKGCSGTWPSHAYDYVQDRGLPALDEYTPYAATVQECQDKRVPPVTHISAHVNVTALSVPAMKLAIRRHAPTVVIIDGKSMSLHSYKSGIYYDDRCNKKKTNHAVLAVGWGGKEGETHLILKNSWSDRWGQGGYVNMHAPSNTCGVLTKPSYPRLEKEDVRKLGGGAAAAGKAADAEDYD